MKLPDNKDTKNLLKEIDLVQKQIAEELENSQNLTHYLQSLNTLEEQIKFMLQKMT